MIFPFLLNTSQLSFHHILCLFLLSAIYDPTTFKEATTRDKQRMNISNMFCVWNSYFDIGSAHSERSTHFMEKSLSYSHGYVLMSLIEPCQYHSAFSWFLSPIFELELGISVIFKSKRIVLRFVYISVAYFVKLSLSLWWKKKKRLTGRERKICVMFFNDICLYLSICV